MAGLAAEIAAVDREPQVYEVEPTREEDAPDSEVFAGDV